MVVFQALSKLLVVHSAVGCAVTILCDAVRLA
jgi:hypothetical protein